MFETKIYDDNSSILIESCKNYIIDYDKFLIYIYYNYI